MAKKPKSRETLAEILAACSDALFPAELGAAPVTLTSRGSDGDTPLHVMLWQKNTYAVLQLVEAGADVNAVGDMSETPLHIAVRQQNPTVVEAMLKADADVSVMSEFGQSPKSLAQELGGEIARLFANR
ncbi:MAG: ankyrin repeat domain-containing protein [Pseudomonadota bacterium]